MIIFMEGADETAKTHIAKALAKKYGLQYWKNEDNEEYEDGTFHELLKYHYAKLPKMCKMFESLHSGVVFDRNYITEAVYAEVFDRPTYRYIIRDLEETYANMGAVTIYCYKSAHREFNDPHITFDKIRPITDEYQLYFDTKSKMPVLHLNTTDEDLKRQLGTIGRFLKETI